MSEQMPEPENPYKGISEDDDTPVDITEPFDEYSQSTIEDIQYDAFAEGAKAQAEIAYREDYRKVPGEEELGIMVMDCTHFDGVHYYCDYRELRCRLLEGR